MSQVAEQNTHQACCRFDVGLVGRFDVSLESVTNSAQTNSKKTNGLLADFFLKICQLLPQTLTVKSKSSASVLQTYPIA